MSRLTAVSLAVALTLGTGLAAGFHVPPAEAQGYRTTTTTEIIRTERRIIVPQRQRRWSEPPRGARRVYGRYWNPSWSWKVDPHTRTVFVVTPSRELWFLDPTSGWAYTIDRWGRVYTADPRSRWVYYVSPIHAWPGDVPYFFSYWEPYNGYYRVPRFDTFAHYYRAPRYRGYDYNYAYDTLWGFERWFYSPSFGRVTAFRHYDPYYVSWRGYYRDTYIDARGRYWWEPDPVSIWRRPSLYRNVTIVQPVYSVRPWQRGLPETARLSSERLAGEMGAARGRDFGGGQRPGRDTVGFNVPLNEVPREPDFGYGRGDIRVAESERSLPQFADPGKPVPAVLASAPVVNPMAAGSVETLAEIPAVPSSGIETRPAEGFNAVPAGGRDTPSFDTPSQKPAGGYGEQPVSGVGSPTVIENLPEARAPDAGRPSGFSEPYQVEPPPQRFEEPSRFEPPAERFREEAPAFKEPQRYEEPARFEPPAERFRDETPTRFEEPQRFEPPAERFREEAPVFQEPERFEEPQRFEPPAERFREEEPRYEEPQRFDPPAERFRDEAPAGFDAPRGRERDTFSSDEEGGGWPR